MFSRRVKIEEAPLTTESDAAKPSRAKPLLLGCGLILFLAVSLPVAGAMYWRHQANIAWEEAKVLQEEKAANAFGPALDSLSEGAKEPAYDIDQTIRVIHEIDRAMEETQDMESYLRAMAKADYRDVAPEILESRKEILEILMPLYAKQTEIGDQKAMWELTSEVLLATLSVVSVSGDVNLVSPAGKLEVDREQAKVLWEELKEQQAASRQLQTDISELEQELFGAMMDYADVYYKYVEEWDSLSVLRDRAYLAANNQDWESARIAAEAAIAKAPKEKEAHLILAMSIIEGGNPEEIGEAVKLLEGYIEDHPGSTAPAFVLLGVAQAKQGDLKQAQLSFQQSSAYYPKQAGELTEMVNPYKMRSYLTKSREGGFILELYKSTMLGAGYFSPDLQQAKSEFEAGDFNAGKTKVLDHFARRRTQEQWDFIISDIQFCHELLGPEFWKIFPEDTYLDLEVSKTMLGSALNLGINNRSPKPLRNATLVLVLHLTDMVPGMYEALPAPATVPVVKPHETTSFGSLDIAIDYAGKTKGVDDIVSSRAIVISNEAVSWVDTDEFKIAELARSKEVAKKAPEQAPEVVERHPQFKSTQEALIAGLSQQVDMSIEQKYGSDNVLIKLPRELSILRPIFRLQYGDQIFSASDNMIEGDEITLRFPAVENFDDVQTTDDMQLIMGSPFGDVVLSWTSDGALTWNYEGVVPE